MELRYVGGTYAGNIKPSPFLCLTLKMLQIQPEKDIIVEFIKNEDFKYVRALGAFYLRLTGSAIDCYKYLEPLLNDYRKIRVQRRDGRFELSHMDEFIDELLREERSCDVILPRIMKRSVLEENNDLEPRVSVLEDDLDAADSSSEEEETKGVEPGRTTSRERESEKSRTRRRSRSPARDRHRRRPSPRERRRRSRTRSPVRRGRRDRSRERHGDGRERDRGGKKDELSVEETNKLRASLGLAPLK